MTVSSMRRLKPSDGVVLPTLRCVGMTVSSMRRLKLISMPMSRNGVSGRNDRKLDEEIETNLAY